MQLFAKLDEEWAAVARSPSGRAALGRWAASHPILGGFADLADVIEFVHRRNQAVANDRVHLALVELALGDALAARTMLCAVQPGLIAIARQYRDLDGDPEELPAFVVAAAWERIRSYPVRRRPSHVAGNVLLDTRQRVTRTVGRHRAELVGLAACGDCQPAVAGPGDDAGVHLRLDLDVARRRGVLNERDAHLITSTRLSGCTVTSHAARRAEPVARLRQQRLRAEAALGAFLSEPN